MNADSGSRFFAGLRKFKNKNIWFHLFIRGGRKICYTVANEGAGQPCGRRYLWEDESEIYIII